MRLRQCPHTHLLDRTPAGGRAPFSLSPSAASAGGDEEERQSEYRW